MSLTEKDSQYLWHPYTQHKTAAAPIAITKGKDALLWDENGKEYIDAIASWWVNPYGHSNTFIADAIYKQLTTLEHVLFGGFTHEPAVEVAEKLLAILPKNQQKLFFSDNGSTAVEIAIKVALQYFFKKEKSELLLLLLKMPFTAILLRPWLPVEFLFLPMLFKACLLMWCEFQFPLLDKKKLVFPLWRNP